VLKDVTTLHNTIKNWLRLEAFIQRGYRAQYIVSYLGQVEAILSYASHKAKSLTNSLAETGGSELRAVPVKKPKTSPPETSSIVPTNAQQ
jgi:hypothetical protein